MSEYWRLRPNQEQLERLQKAIKKYGTQGEIKLPKEYKYEEFKKWFRKNCKNEVDLDWLNDVFIDFEKELEEKQKEKEIRRIIISAFNNNCDVYTMTDEICTELEKEGYLR